MIFSYIVLILFVAIVVLFGILIKLKNKEIFLLGEIVGCLRRLDFSTVKNINSSHIFKSTENTNGLHQDFPNFEEVDENLVLSTLYNIGKKELKSNFKSVGITDMKDSENIEDSVSKLKGIGENVENKK